MTRRYRVFWALAGALVLSLSAFMGAQTGTSAPAATPSLFKDLRWRNIGPANMSGRAVDIEALESNPAVVYLAAASGGVWKSVNAGTTWDPIFTQYGTASIGDIGLYQRDPNIVWVGSGEACVRNSVQWGDGIYKSTDGGKTFTNVGLGESHHIGRVVTHPTNPDIVYVAAGGHLWGSNPERGVFKTIDGGKTWRKLAGGLPNNNTTGAGDLVMDPTNPNILYAGMWERIRRRYIFESGGPNGGLFKSTDGGETWKKLAGGLPTGKTGKIGLAIHRRDPKVLTAIVEAPRSADPAVPGGGIYRSEDAGATWRQVNTANNRPFYFSHIYLDPNHANRLYVLAGSAQVSEDGGRTFARSLQGIEGDFHALWIDPANSDRFYVGNDKGGYVTYDRGSRFIMFDNMDIAQFYAVTADMRDPYYVYGGLQDSGNWGGPSNSRDFNGILNDHWFKFHSGDGFHATPDPHDWRIVYTESQNGGIRRNDGLFRQDGRSIRPTPATTLNQAEVTAREGKAPTFRYNWSTPFILSPHDSKTLYFGSNHLFKSVDRGDTWTIISPDLSTSNPDFTAPLPADFLGERTGAETLATIITVVESPLVPGVIWAGTDDGNVQVTRNGGVAWTNVRNNIPATLVPQGRWVSRVEPSHFDPAIAYVSFDGHRNDDFKPYVLKTTDYGRTWSSVASNLPARETVFVVKEDLKNPRLLFVGTQRGVHASVDAGASWHRLGNDFPVVSVHDLVIHPRDGDLIAGTHGRGIMILDDITALQQFTPDVAASDVHLFTNKVATIWQGVSRGATRGHMLFQGRNPLTIAHRPPANSPSELANSATVSYYVRSAPETSSGRVEIASLDGTRTFTAEVPAGAGINRYFWNLRFGGVGGAGGGGGRGATAGGARAGAGGAGATAGSAGATAGGTAAGAAGAGGAGATAGGAAAAAAGQGRGGGRGGRGGGDMTAGEGTDAPPAFAGGAQNAAGPGTYKVKLTIGGKDYFTTITVRADPDKR